MKYCVNMATAHNKPTPKGYNHPRTNSGSLAMLAAMAVTGSSSLSRRRAARTRARKRRPAAGTVETMVIDVIEEPVPGVVAITEFEEVRIPMPSSDEETKDKVPTSLAEVRLQLHTGEQRPRYQSAASLLRPPQHSAHDAL